MKFTTFCCAHHLYAKGKNKRSKRMFQYLRSHQQNIQRAIPDRLRDWLNHPKGKWLSGTHVTLMSKQEDGLKCRSVSDRMDEVAERVAAHWKQLKTGKRVNIQKMRTN